MTFVSFAQNFEDVLLWRALGHIKNGFYVDVGANDPVEDSVTKAFYDRGWNGINIEPLYTHFVDLNRERRRDINLFCAAGAVPGELNLWECGIRGWATADPAVIAQHEEHGHAGRIHRVKVKTLAGLLERHSRGDIHFLKIDVEGFETAVIQGMDFKRFRPWILVIEATRPNAPEEHHEEWESLVLREGYQPLYFDGLNRYYFAAEHPELVRHFRLPPNVFDDFVGAREHRLKAQVEQLLQVCGATEKAKEIAVQERAALRSELSQTHASLSWQLTHPLRWFKLQLGLLKAHGPVQRLQALALKCLGVKTSHNNPSQLPPEPPLPCPPAETDAARLSPRVQDTYVELMKQINSSNT